MSAIGKQLAVAGLLLALAYQIEPAAAENPISAEFSADPSVHLINGRFYLYATNDQGNSGKYWDSMDWRLYTSDDLAHWKDEGPFLKASIFGWAAKAAKAWAPEASFRNGKYYFYAPVGGNRSVLPSATSPKARLSTLWGMRSSNRRVTPMPATNLSIRLCSSTLTAKPICISGHACRRSSN